MVSTHIRALAAALRTASEEACKNQWDTYRSEHPDTKKEEAEYIKECLGDSPPQDQPAPAGASPTPPKAKSKKDQDALKGHGISPDVSSEDLDEALDDILGDDGSGKDIGEKLHSVAEKLVDVVDVDEYVLGLPQKAKAMALHLKGEQKKQQDEASKAKDKGGTYEDYKKRKLDQSEPPISKSEWDALKAQKKPEKKPGEKKTEPPAEPATKP